MAEQGVDRPEPFPAASSGLLKPAAVSAKVETRRNEVDIVGMGYIHG